MNRKSQCLVAAAAFISGAVVIYSLSAQEVETQPEFKLPPGWTAEDLQACVAAGTPGKMHEHLAKSVGTWDCKTTMWIAPNTEPVKGAGTMTVASLMDGRYIQCEIAGESPGLGTYSGKGFYGFDNVTGKFVATFIDNHSTGIMTGTGDLTDEGKALTWSYTHSCPITKKPATMREVETITGPDTKTIVTHAADPKTGKEFKMMSIEMTRRKAGG
ncbi:MAG: DUF1579 domain-containing protein [Planctomycetaceae bacterium]